VRGQTSRVRVLVPSDWKLAAPPGEAAMVGQFDTISFTPQERYRWMPERFRRLFDRPRETVASMTLQFGMDSTGLVGGTRFADSTQVPAWYPRHRGVWKAVRTVDASPGYSLVYYRGDRHEFETTYRRICDSLQVVREE
jgi:hypothetical protein